MKILTSVIIALTATFGCQAADTTKSELAGSDNIESIDLRSDGLFDVTCKDGQQIQITQYSLDNLEEVCVPEPIVETDLIFEESISLEKQYTNISIDVESSGMFYIRSASNTPVQIKLLQDTNLITVASSIVGNVFNHEIPKQHREIKLTGFTYLAAGPYNLQIRKLNLGDPTSSGTQIKIGKAKPSTFVELDADVGIQQVGVDKPQNPSRPTFASRRENAVTTLKFDVVKKGEYKIFMEAKNHMNRLRKSTSTILTSGIANSAKLKERIWVSNDSFDIKLNPGPHQLTIYSRHHKSTRYSYKIEEKLTHSTSTAMYVCKSSLDFDLEIDLDSLKIGKLLRRRVAKPIQAIQSSNYIRVVPHEKYELKAHASYLVEIKINENDPARSEMWIQNGFLGGARPVPKMVPTICELN